MANKKQNKKMLKPRNWTVIAAFQRGGGGTHNDRRTRRQRTRGAQKRAALQD